MDDCSIIALYLDRSENAISQTAQKYGRYCHYIAYNILQDDLDSEECVNDTYLRTWNAIPPQKPNNLRTFLGKIVRNLALNRYEKRTAEKRGFGQTALLLDELSECIPSADSTEQMEDSLLVKELLNRFLRSLDPKERKMFVRRYWYASSVREIAKTYGLTENAVTVTLYRTRQKLKKVLEKEGVML